MTSSIEVHGVCRQNLGRRCFTALAAFVRQDTVVMAKFGEASLTAELVSDSTHHHLTQRRCNFGTDGARSTTSGTASSCLARLAAVYNSLLGTTNFPRRYNCTAVILNILRTVDTCCNRLLERIQTTLQRAHTHTTAIFQFSRINSGIEHSASLVLRRGTVCRRTFVLHQHSVLSKICSRLIYFFIHFNYLLNFEKRMLYGALAVTLWTCYGAL